MRKVLFCSFYLVLVCMCNFCFAQKPKKSSISLSGGYGMDYGGLGGKVAINPTENFAIVGGLGNYFGPPLSFGSIDHYGKLTGKNLTGLGFSVGIEYTYPNPSFGGGLHYIVTGKYNDEESLQGINWCMFGGDIYFNQVPLFIHYGVNLGLVFNNGGGGMFGISLGFSYSFGLSKTESDVQTKRLRNL